MNDPLPPVTVTITAEMWDEMARAQTRTVRSLVRLVLVVLLVIGALVGFLGWRSYASQSRQDQALVRQACTARITGDAFGRAFEALSAPPVAPNLTPEELGKTARGLAVARGLADARKLENIDRYC